MTLDKKYDFKAVESGRYDVWKEKGYFLAGDKSKQKFSMVIPPPNVTGKLHIGHAIDNTIQDITCRYKKAKGFDVLYLPGVDHAGIATQAKVDAKLNKQGTNRFEIGREAFLKECYAWKEEYAGFIHDQWAKMGIMVDYSRERFTLDAGCVEAVNTVFVQLYNEGLIYQGERIVNYDPVMKTALSNIEVVYQEDDGEFFYFKYPFVNDKSKFLTIATTRPETMFGDTCIVVNPKDPRYKDVIGQKVINPANYEELPIIADEYVDIEFGTGAMKCTPAHDPNDFVIGKKYNMPHPVIMNTDGTMCENTGIYANMDRFECRKKLLENIEKDGNLIKIEKIKHKVGHSERSGAVVEPILSKQWFIKMKPLAARLLENQKNEDTKVNFYPKRFEKVLTRWMENVDDWCISRQLWWGHRIPVYYSKIDGSIICSATKPADMENYVQDEDVLDTWFSSALWPFETLGWPQDTEDFKRYYPLDCMVTGYDIIFFWVSRMVFQGLHFTDVRPFKDVVIHGLVREEKGRKMSKSLGNGVDPIDVINTYGVDSLRYFLATTASPGQDMRYVEEKVKASSSYLNKIWNSARFLLMNLPEDYREKAIEEIDLKKLNKVDKYILTKLEKVIKNVTKKMDVYDFGGASTEVYNFVYDDFCSFYIEMSKVTLKDENAYLEGTYFTMLHVLKAVLMMIYPFSPFITEEIYLSLPTHKESIMLESYPEYDKRLVFASTLPQVSRIREAIEAIRVYKVNNKLAPNAPLDLKVKTSLKAKDLYPYLSRFSFASSLEEVKEDVQDAYSINLPSFTLYVIDNRDKGELKANLEKEIARLRSELDRSEKMLGNPNFIQKAPKEKIKIEEEKYANNKKLFEELSAQLKNL